MIKKLVSHLGEYKAASIKTPLFAALEAIMDVLLPTIMAFIIDQGIEKGDMNAIIRYGLLTFLVAAIALEKNCYFLNLWEVLADENGDLIESYAQPDGYHLRPAGYAVWTDYLCSHTEG